MLFRSWYIDSGCSHHMTGDKSKMDYFKKNQDGKVILSNDAPTKVFRKGRDKINKLRVGQMEDKGM